MEINLMYVFITTVGLGLIAIILLGLLLNKTKQMNESISEQNSKGYNNLLKVLNDLSASVNLRFDGVIAAQNGNKEQNISLLKLIENHLKEISASTLNHFEELSQQNTNSKDSVKAISKSMNLRFDDVINEQAESKKTDVNLRELIINNFNETLSTYKKQFAELAEQSANNSESYKQFLVDSTQNISTSINQLSDFQSNIHCENKELIKKVEAKVSANLEDMETTSAKHFEVLKKEHKDSNASTQKQFSETHEHISDKVSSLSRVLNSELKAQSFKTKQERTSDFEQLSNLIQTIRVENLSEITNNIAKQKNLKISTSDFEKHLGDCKVVQMTDKHTGQVTRFNYEKGVKRSSDTLVGDVLKYQMFFDNEGKVSKGVEFNDKGDIAFEYEYDKAGEIGKRYEYIYSAKAKTPKKIEKVY